MYAVWISTQNGRSDDCVMFYSGYAKWVRVFLLTQTDCIFLIFVMCIFKLWSFEGHDVCYQLHEEKQ